MSALIGPAALVSAAHAYMREIPEDFEKSVSSRYMAFRYDTDGSELQTFRIDTEADSFSYAGKCYDIEFEKRFNLTGAAPAGAVQVYDERGCTSTILEQGVLNCTSGGVTGVNTGTSPNNSEAEGAGGEGDTANPFDEIDDIIIQAEEGVGSGWTEESRGARAAMRYMGAATGTCDPMAAVTYSFSVPVEADYKIKLTMTGACDEACPGDAAASAVCMSLDNGETGTLQLDGLSELWLVSTVKTVRLVPDREYKLILFGAQAGTSVDRITISPPRAATGALYAGAQALQDCIYTPADGIVP